MEYQASIADPDQWLWSATLWRFDFGAYGAAHIYVWEDGMEGALEIAAQYARDRGWDGLFSEPDLDDARKELSSEGAQPSDDEIWDEATQGLTYTGSGYLVSHEWWGTEISAEQWEYQQVRVASQILPAYPDAVLDVAIDTEWDPESEMWLSGPWTVGLVPSIVARLRPFCDYLLPVTMFPHFLVPSPSPPFHKPIKRWIVALACEQGQLEARRELLSVVNELNLLSEAEVSREVIPTTGDNWVQFAEEVQPHEGEADPQQYALRRSVILRIFLSRYSDPIEIEFAFFERYYDPDFQEFED